MLRILERDDGNGSTMMMDNWDDIPRIPASASAMAEAEELSAEILEDIELNRVKLSVVVLKVVRLARLINDFDHQQIFLWESSGYPTGKNGIERHVWDLGSIAGRTLFRAGVNGEEPQEVMDRSSIEQLERSVDLGEASIQAARDPDISLSSANEFQHVRAPAGNAAERRSIRSEVSQRSQRLAARRTFIYDYAARKHYELKFSAVADDVFGKVRSFVDASIGEVVPNAVRKFSAVYSNLRSDNPEDWANAAHSCRRILQDLADAVFPARSDTRTRTVDGKTREIKLGSEQYINRLLAFIEDMSTSERFDSIVGSHLEYMGHRLDAMFKAAQKGSHASVTMEEANRCVVYTYLLVGDILSLNPTVPSPIEMEDDDRAYLEDGELSAVEP